MHGGLGGSPLAAYPKLAELEERKSRIARLGVRHCPSAPPTPENFECDSSGVDTKMWTRPVPDCRTLRCGQGLFRTVHLFTPASSKVKNNIRHAKPEEWRPCLAHELKA